MEYGILKIDEREISNTDDLIEITPEMNKLSFTSNNDNFINSFEFSYDISIQETYSTSCGIFLTIKECYPSCKGCFHDINAGTGDHHNCIQCKEGYFPSPIENTSCFTKEELEERFPGIYFNEETQLFSECHSDCKTCNGVNNDNCLSCDIGKYLYNGKCLISCPNGTFIQTQDENFICKDCYPNCKECNELGDSSNMKCKSCPDDKIKNGSNCYTIKDNTKKTFYDPDDSTIILSCKETFGKYIIENTNECIDKPEENYFVSNIFTGILSPCNNKCKTCSRGPTPDNSNCDSCKPDNIFSLFQKGNCVDKCSNGYYQNDTQCLKCHNNCLTCDTGMLTDSDGKLKNMKCTKCLLLLSAEKAQNERNDFFPGILRYLVPEIGQKEQQSNQELFKPLMIKNDENCFPVIIYNQTHIIFNISEIYPDIKNATCLLFNKSIYYGENECIEKPEHTFYVLNNEENTGIIKNCSIECDTCLGEKTFKDTNCIKCADGYFKTEDSNTNCILKNLIPHNYYLNKLDNV